MSIYNIGKYMKQKDKEHTDIVVINRQPKRFIDDKTKNWKRISLNDFGTRYSKNFIDTKKREKMLWKNLFSQKSMIDSKEE